MTAFDGGHRTPPPPPPRDPGESSPWWQELREHQRAFGEVRDAVIASVGRDGKDGRLDEARRDIAAMKQQREADLEAAEETRTKDRTFTRWLLGLLGGALISLAGFGAGAWSQLGDRVTAGEVERSATRVTLDAQLERIRYQQSLIEALMQRGGAP